MIKMILAINEVNAIGKDGGLMYRLKADMLNFKEMTMGATVVMGRKTYDSLKKPLPGRVNFVVTSGGLSDTDIKLKTPINVLNSEGFLDLLKANQTSEEVIWIIGGATLYEQAVGFASEIICTFVDGEEEGDTYLPDGLFGDFVQFNTLKQVDADEHNERTHDIVHLVRNIPHSQNPCLVEMEAPEVITLSTDLNAQLATTLMPTGQDFEKPVGKTDYTFGNETNDVINATGEKIGFKVTGVHGDREVTPTVVFLDAEGNPLTPEAELDLKTQLASTPFPTGKKFGTAVVRMLSIEEIVDGLEVHQAINEIANKEHELVISLFRQGQVSEAWDRLVKFYEIVCPETAKDRVAVYATDDQRRDHVVNVVTYGIQILGADDQHQWGEDTVKQLLKNFTGAIS